MMGHVSRLALNPQAKPRGETMPAATLSKKQRDELLETLKNRFEKNMSRHKALAWADVSARLLLNDRALWSLHEMERTGGEPDVIGKEKATGAFIFCDCSPESPDGRRNTCYDRAGLQKRQKEGLSPVGNVLDMSAAMGIEPLNEEDYRDLQKLGSFDLKSQSWLKTPDEITKLGGAIFADRRFGRVFVYHNTAPCFYRARGFRGSLKV
jgi:hypothetical protein